MITPRDPEHLALVTGGSSGLGAALCQVLAQSGYAVVEFSRTGARDGSMPLDLDDPERSGSAVVGVLGSLDLGRLRDFIFVSNAATLDPTGPVLHQPLSAQVRSLNVNLVSAVAMISAAFGILENAACRKVLVNVSSGAARSAHPGLALYGAAKSGMEHFVRGLAAEQARCRYPVTAVNFDPGAMDTPMQRHLRSADATVFPESAHFGDRHRRGELADPARVAAEIVRIARSETLDSGARYGMRDHAEPSSQR